MTQTTTDAAIRSWHEFKADHPDLAADEAGARVAAAEHFRAAAARGEDYATACAGLSEGVAQRMRDQSDEGRTAGMFGGGSSGGKPGGGEADEPSNFAAELSRAQDSLWKK